MTVASETRPGARRWWMLVRGFLSQNVTIGCSYGTFGISMIGLQERYDAGRGAISLGFSLVILGMGLLGPLISRAVERFGFRRTMMIGVVLAGSGYALLASSSHIVAFFIAFGFLIGPGVAMAGTLPVGLMVGDWFPEWRGRAVGLATMPVLLTFMPMLGVLLIEELELGGFYTIVSVLHFSLLAVILGIRGTPVRRARPDGPAQHEGVSESGPVKGPAMRIVRRPIFWLLVLSGGILNAVSITGVANIVSLLIEQGTSPARAAMMASMMGAAAVCGTLGIGWLCDHLGGARALALAALGLAGSWFALVLEPGFALTLGALILIGACGAGTFPAVTVISSRLFGLAQLGKALGLFGLFTVPLTFALPPLAGWLHDATDGYPAVIAFIVAGCGVVAVNFVLLSRVERRSAVA